LRHVSAEDIAAKGASAAATEALHLTHADTRGFVLHLDLDVIAQEDFPPVNVPASGGLSLDDVRAALREFARSNNLLGLDVAQYNPDKDPAGAGAKKIVDLIVDALSARLEAPSSPAPDDAAARTPENAAAAAAHESADVTRTPEDAAVARRSEDAAVTPSSDAVAAPDSALDAPEESTSDIAPQKS
jgi:hypothetical protein